nr:MAG TPA: hypothetical protein [Caudoviricetes sp.]
MQGSFFFVVQRPVLLSEEVCSSSLQALYYTNSCHLSTIILHFSVEIVKKFLTSDTF